MKENIREHIEEPEVLEELYRADKKGFEEALFEIYPEISTHKIAEFWKARLAFSGAKEATFKTETRDVVFMIVACAIAALLIEIPHFFKISLSEYFFYEKNAGIIVLSGLSIYAFLSKRSFTVKHLLITVSVFIIAAIYINLLPSKQESSSIILAYIHLPLMIWCLYGIIYTGFDLKDKSKRMDYIKYNGDMAILVAIMAIAGGILTGVTIGLFSAIGLEIEQFYLEWVVIPGAVAVPVVATFIIRNYPVVTNKLAPIIANLFSPLVLVTLVIYLVSIIVTGKDPYNDRDFLIVFNLMLLGVMGIVVFSISETSANKRQPILELTLFALSIITLIIDGIALSAILYRLGEFGFTPNRVVVLGSNILIFINLVFIAIDLFRAEFRSKEIKQVELTIANYLPVYALWTVFVVFVLPLIFGLK